MKKTGQGDMPENPEGGFEGKAPGERISKNEDMDQDDEFGDEDDDDDDDEDEMKKKAKKSETIEGDLLMKSLDSLQVAAEQSAPGADRRAELANKLAKGQASREEQEELGRLLSGDEGDADDSLGKSLSDVLHDDADVQDAYNASAFIEKQSELVAKSIDGLAERMTKAQSNQHAFNTALAKSFHDLGSAFVQQQELVKSQQAQLQAVSARLGIVERQPQPRRAATAASGKPLAKSFEGQGEQPLTPQEVSVGLERLMIKSQANNWMLPCGEPVDVAVAKFETSGQLSEGVQRDIRKALAEG